MSGEKPAGSVPSEERHRAARLRMEADEVNSTLGEAIPIAANLVASNDPTWFPPVWTPQAQETVRAEIAHLLERVSARRAAFLLRMAGLPAPRTSKSVLARIVADSWRGLNQITRGLVVALLISANLSTFANAAVQWAGRKVWTSWLATCYKSIGADGKTVCVPNMWSPMPEIIRDGDYNGMFHMESGNSPTPSGHVLLPAGAEPTVTAMPTIHPSPTPPFSEKLFEEMADAYTRADVREDPAPQTPVELLVNFLAYVWSFLFVSIFGNGFGSSLAYSAACVSLFFIILVSFGLLIRVVVEIVVWGIEFFHLCLIVFAYSYNGIKRAFGKAMHVVLGPFWTDPDDEYYSSLDVKPSDIEASVILESVKFEDGHWTGILNDGVRPMVANLDPIVHQVGVKPWPTNRAERAFVKESVKRGSVFASTSCREDMILLYDQIEGTQMIRFVGGAARVGDFLVSAGHCFNSARTVVLESHKGLRAAINFHDMVLNTDFVRLGDSIAIHLPNKIWGLIQTKSAKLVSMNDLWTRAGPITVQINTFGLVDKTSKTPLLNLKTATGPATVKGFKLTHFASTVEGFSGFGIYYSNRLVALQAAGAYIQSQPNAAYMIHPLVDLAERKLLHKAAKETARSYASSPSTTEFEEGMFDDWSSEETYSVETIDADDIYVFRGGKYIHMNDDQYASIQPGTWAQDREAWSDDETGGMYDDIRDEGSHSRWQESAANKKPLLPAQSSGEYQDQSSDQVFPVTKTFLSEQLEDCDVLLTMREADTTNKYDTAPLRALCNEFKHQLALCSKPEELRMVATEVTALVEKVRSAYKAPIGKTVFESGKAKERATLPTFEVKMAELSRRLRSINPSGLVKETARECSVELSEDDEMSAYAGLTIRESPKKDVVWSDLDLINAVNSELGMKIHDLYFTSSRNLVDLLRDKLASNDSAYRSVDNIGAGEEVKRGVETFLTELGQFQAWLQALASNTRGKYLRISPQPVKKKGSGETFEVDPYPSEAHEVKAAEPILESGRLTLASPAQVCAVESVKETLAVPIAEDWASHACLQLLKQWTVDAKKLFWEAKPEEDMKHLPNLKAYVQQMALIKWPQAGDVQEFDRLWLPIFREIVNLGDFKMKAANILDAATGYQAAVRELNFLRRRLRIGDGEPSLIDELEAAVAAKKTTEEARKKASDELAKTKAELKRVEKELAESKAKYLNSKRGPPKKKGGAPSHPKEDSQESPKGKGKSLKTKGSRGSAPKPSSGQIPTQKPKSEASDTTLSG